MTVLRTDSEFDAFCGDYFPRTYRQLARGMDANQKTTLLLEEQESAQILDALTARFPKHEAVELAALRHGEWAAGSYVSYQTNARLLSPLPCAWQHVSFDLGTIWGLERGGFIGIVHGEHTLRRMFLALQSCERQFQIACARRPALALGQRQWLLIDNYPQGGIPVPLAELLLEQAPSGSSAKLPITVPQLHGFLWVVRTPAEIDWSAVLCQRILAERPCGQAVAMVIAVEGPPSFGAESQSQRLEQLLTRGGRHTQVGRLPVERAVLLPLFDGTQLPRGPSAARSPWAAQDSEALAAFCQTIIRTPIIGDRSSVAREYPLLSSWIQEHRARIPNGGSAIDYTALPDELLTLGEQPAAAMYTEMCRFASEHCRALLPALLFVSGACQSNSLRRVGLRQTKELGDLDYWLAGTAYERALLPTLDELMLLQSDVGSQDQHLLTRLVLGLLRAYYRGEVAAKNSLDDYAPYCFSDLKRLYEDCGGTPEIETYNEQQLMNAALVGAPFKQPQEVDVPSEALTGSAPWWWLGSRAPESAWIDAALRCPAEQRAALGLLTAQEGAAFMDDATIHEAVVERRRGRELAAYEK